MSDVPSDIVELIIAVDLNPTDPEEPINVSSVDVRDKGGSSAGDEDWKGLTVQLLMGDPASGITSDQVSYEQAVEAVAKVLGDEEEEQDAFSMHSKKPQPPAPSGRRPEGGMKKTLSHILGSGEIEDEED